MASTPLAPELRRREPLPADALHLRLHGGSPETQPCLSTATREGPDASFLPGGPGGRCYLGGVGADCCSKVHPCRPPRCPRSRGTGSPGPKPSPSAPGQGIGPAAPACGLGPSTLARVTVRGRGREREQSVTRTAPSPTPPRFPPTPAPPQPPEQGTRTTQAELSSTLPGAARKPVPRLEPPGESGAPEGRPVPAWGGERPLDGAGRDGGGGPSGRGAGCGVGAGEGGRRRGARGHKVTWGWGGRLPAPGEGPVPRQGSSPKAVLWDNSGSPEEPRGRGGVEARRSGGLEAGAWGAGTPTGQGAEPRVPGGK